MFQNLKQQYYTGYTESEVLEVMRHMAKNVVRVNENMTKFTVSTLPAPGQTRLRVQGMRGRVCMCLHLHVNTLACV